MSAFGFKHHALVYWCNLDGDSSGAAARDSFNVSSTSDGGAGLYHCVFTNNLANDDYSQQIACNVDGDFVVINTGDVNSSNSGSTSQTARSQTARRDNGSGQDVMFCHFMGAGDVT